MFHASKPKLPNYHLCETSLLSYFKLKLEDQNKNWDSHTVYKTSAEARRS